MLISYKKPRGRFFVVGGKAQPVVEWTVTVTAGSNGSVSVDGVSGNYSATVPDGTVLALSATASEHYSFSQWSDGSTSATRTVTVTGDLNLTASFAIDTYVVNIIAGSNGSVSVNGVSGNYSQSVAYGTQLEVAATPAMGYDFTAWSDGNTDNPRTLTVTGSISLTAGFQAETQYYQVDIYSSGAYTIVVDGVEGDYSQSVAEGTELSVEAITDEEDFIFDGWSDGNTDNPRTLTVDGQIDLTAYFHEDVEPTYLTVNGVQNEGTVSINGGAADYSVTEQVVPGDCCQIEAFPEEGYEFVEWTTQGQASVNDPTENPTYACTGVENGSTNIVDAVFQQIGEDFNVDIHAGANGSVSVDGVPGDYLETVPGGTVLTIEAEADTDYEFTQWSDGNTDNPRTLTVDSDISLSASFQQAAPQFKHFYVEDASGNDNTLSITDTTQSNPTEVFKSTDRVNWTSMGTTSSTPITATVPANGRLYLKASTSAMDRNRMTCSSDYKVGGQAASLLFGDNYMNSALGPTNNGAFRDLFYMSATLTDASDLVLPGTVSEYCYEYMFYGCTSLTAAPTLSATTLAQNCYNGMFNGCSSLAAAPALPAATMAQGCYSSMFKDCTSLTAAPTLSATTLAQNCYYAMFNGCTGIATAPALPATTLAQGCYYTMFAGCTSLTTAPTLPAATLADSCYRNMFGRCSSLTAAPALPVTTLANLCYYAMFNGCTSLAAAPALPATTLLDNCYAYMFQGCSSLTTAPTLPAATLVQSCYTHMFQDCTSLNSVTTYADDISASLCLDDWLDNVAATGTFNNLGSAVYPSGASGIPSGWTPPQPQQPEYFYVKDLSGSANTLTLTAGNDGNRPVVSVSVSTDMTNWSGPTEITTDGITFTVPADGKLYLKATANRWNYSTGRNGGNWISCSGRYAVGGCINSLLFGDNYQNSTLASTNYSCFTYLFSDSTNLEDASYLIMPTTVAGNCYRNMFQGCTSLTTAPELPATTLSSSCYYSMFSGCTSLQTAPELPATTLDSSCYRSMFEGCTSLQTAPELPATTLIMSCYFSMFQGCTSLQTAPELPATTLVSSCYRNMFYNCRNLSEISIYADSISANYCLTSWLYGVASTGTFHNLGSAVYPSGASGKPSGWTEVHS